MAVPLEVVAAPFEIWIAPVGESFPAIEDAPVGNWVKIGTSGNRSITEDGVTVQHPQTNEKFRSLGSTGPIKAFRTEEDLIIAFTIADITLENYRHALGQNTVTDTAAISGVAGFRDIDIYLGLDVDQRALLVRGLNASPYLALTDIQYQVPIVYENGSPEIVSQKGTPIGLALEYIAIEDPSAATSADRFGKLIAMDEVAL